MKKTYLLYDGERFVRELSFIEAVKESGLSKPTFMRKVKENCGVIKKKYMYIVKKGSKYRICYLLELTKFFIEKNFETEKVLPDVENFYKKISLTL